MGVGGRVEKRRVKDLRSGGDVLKSARVEKGHVEGGMEWKKGGGGGTGVGKRTGFFFLHEDG